MKKIRDLFLYVFWTYIAYLIFYWLVRFLVWVSEEPVKFIIDAVNQLL